MKPPTHTRKSWLATWIAVTCAAVAPASVVVDERSAASASLGSVSGEVSVARDGKPASASRVVVYIEGLPRTAAPSNAEVRQHDLTFSPELVVVSKGATVEFPNDDKVFHNVFSLSETSRFDLGLYKSGTSKSVSFEKAGVVDLFCNIHPNMSAKIKVVDSGYFAVTGADGRFSIGRVPPGKYTVVAWHPTGDETRASLEVVAGGAATTRFALTEKPVSRRHSRKDGTPYGRYQ